MGDFLTWACSKLVGERWEIGDLREGFRKLGFGVKWRIEELEFLVDREMTKNLKIFFDFFHQSHIKICSSRKEQEDRRSRRVSCEEIERKIQESRRERERDRGKFDLCCSLFLSYVVDVKDLCKSA